MTGRWCGRSLISRSRAAKPVQVGTDETWKAKASPITPLGKGTAFGDYGGERYDARLEVPDWNAAELDDSGWEAAATFDPPQVTTSAQMVEPNRILETIKPVKIEKTAGGRLADRHGQELHRLAGLRLPADLAAGKNLKIEFADNPPTGGRYATYNQRDEYVTRAGAGQVVRSRFNYHAFRYAHVTGLEQAPATAGCQGLFHAHQLRARRRSSSRSNDLLNRIYRLVTWTYQCLSLNGYVVDCPTRERLGYGGDAGTSLETGLFNFDTGGLYSRWAANWRDAQDPAIRRPAVHRAQLPGRGRRRADVEWLRGHHALAGLSELWRQGGARNQLSDDPEVAGLRRNEDQRPHPGAVREYRDPPDGVELPGRLGVAVAHRRRRPIWRSRC